MRKSIEQRGNKRGFLSLHGCFLRQKRCMLTTSTAKMNSHECKMMQLEKEKEKENRTSCLQTSADTLNSLAAAIFFHCSCEPMLSCRKFMPLLLQIARSPLLTQRGSASIAHQMLTACDEVRLSFPNWPVLLLFPVECVSAAEQMCSSSSLVANAAQTRMYRKLSKKESHTLLWLWYIRPQSCLFLYERNKTV